MSKSLNLCFNEFEVLQLLVHMGEKSVPEMADAIPILSAIELNDSTKSLEAKDLVRRTGDRFIAKPAAESALEPFRVKRAVILAAGRGTRMLPATNKVPKAMMNIVNKRLIETQLDALLAADITDITIVRGYLGEAFDSLLIDYPKIKFIDNPDWSTTEAVVSTSLAVDLLSDAYLIEGDLYISNPDVVRPYEYRSSYCGAPQAVKADWFYCADNDGRLKKLSFGDSTNNCNNPHRFIGIMFWASQYTEQLKTDLARAVENPLNQHRFIESVPFDTLSSKYNIYARPLQPNEVTEVDTIEEVQALKAQIER